VALVVVTPADPEVAMSRTLARRLTVLTAVGGCLAAAALPAVAQTPVEHQVSVTAVAAGGSRTFAVLKPDLPDTPLSSLTFNGNGEQPFRVVVKDANKGLDGGFEVSASMTNLYFKDLATAKHDLTSIIPSRNLAIAYDSTTPLSATGVTVPVLPQVKVTGTLPTCADPAVATLLGIPPVTDLLDINAVLKLLSGPQRLVCENLGTGAGLPVDGTVTEAPLDLAVPVATSLLGLGDLPLSLAGGQESGAFSHPSYRGPVATADAPANPTPATTKRLMTGRPQVSPSLLTGLNGALATAVGSVYGTADSLIDQNELLTALAGSSPGLVTGLEGLNDPAKVETLLTPLSKTLATLDAAALSKISGDYTARPVLRANTTAARPGTYEGTLTIDFFDGVK
jgi:hypothetical protein